MKWYGVITEVSVQGELQKRIGECGTSGTPYPCEAVAPTANHSGPSASGLASIVETGDADTPCLAVETEETLSSEHLVSMLIRMFEFAPIAMSITTSDTRTSSYVKVNEAYLRLTGLKWDDVKGKKLTDDGASIDNPARDRRHRLLAEEGSAVRGGYQLCRRHDYSDPDFRATHDD